MSILPIDQYTVGAYSEEDKKLVVVALNCKNKEKNLTLDLGEFSPEVNVKTVRTSGSLTDGEQWKEYDCDKTDGSIFSSALKPYSVTTFIFNTK